MYKGIILAGGSGSRLLPLTRCTSKQLLPVYDRPMIFFPLSTMMLAGIREILIITSPRDQASFKDLLGDGSPLGLTIQYAEQPTPEGIAQALLIGKHFIGHDSVMLILGDNIFHDEALANTLAQATARARGATIFAKQVCNPSDFGVVELDEYGNATSVEEKPGDPRSNLAVTGLYFFDNGAVEIASHLRPSLRGELEIIDLIREYQLLGGLHVEVLEESTVWFDAGTFESLLRASGFVRDSQACRARSVRCPEEIAFMRNYISRDDLLSLSEQYKNQYGRYLRDVALSAPIHAPSDCLRPRTEKQSLQFSDASEP